MVNTTRNVLIMYRCTLNYFKNINSKKAWKYQRDEPVLTDDGAIDDLTGNNTSALFKCKKKRTDQTGGNGTKDVKIMVPLKYE